MSVPMHWTHVVDKSHVSAWSTVYGIEVLLEYLCMSLYHCTFVCEITDVYIYNPNCQLTSDWEWYNYYWSHQEWGR